MIPDYFVWFGAVLLLGGAGSYIADIFKGTVKPNLVTWFLWALAPLIAFFAQLQEGTGAGAVLTLAVGLGPALVVVAALRKGTLRITRFDYVCGAASLVALLLWQVTGNGLLAIVLSVVADVLAATPTIVKAFRYPRTESPLFFVLFMVSAGITLLTLKRWTIENSLFAVYIFVLYTVLFTLVYFRIGERLRAAGLLTEDDTV